MRLLIVIAALALCACERQEETPVAMVVRAQPIEPPPPVFAGDIDGRGTDPFFWLLKIRADKLTLTRPAHNDLMAANIGPKMKNGAAVWESGTDAPLSVTLVDAPCKDGVSDQEYALTAMIRAGTDILKGCAGKVDAPLPEPRLQGRQRGG